MIKAGTAESEKFAVLVACGGLRCLAVFHGGNGINGIKNRGRVTRPLRLSRNDSPSVEDRAAGVREGARPTSRSNKPPKKSLDF